MPTLFSYRRIFRPKNRQAKFTVHTSTTYKITSNSDGSPKITKIQFRKIYVNGSKSG